MQHIYDSSKLIQRISDQVLNNDQLCDMKDNEYSIADVSVHTPAGISDSEDEEPIRHTRVSLMIDDLTSQSDLRMSLLHSTTVRQTSKPTAPTIPSNADVVKAVRPPPIPTSAIPSTGTLSSHSTISSIESTSKSASLNDRNSIPSSQSSVKPSSQPPTLPSSQPPTLPSSQPPTLPSSQPPTLPSSQPPTLPSSQPPTLPSSQPPTLPSSQPSVKPSSQPPSIPVPSIPAASSASSPPISSKPSVAPGNPPRPSMNALLAEIRASGVDTKHRLNDRDA